MVLEVLVTTNATSVVMLTRTPSFFSSIPLAPPNSILGVAQQCRNDAYANKIDLTIGAYRDDQGKPHVLHVIREAEEIIYNSKMDHEYLPQDGLAEFNSAAAKLLFGENAPILNNGCVYTIQGLSGTGCLRLGIDFLAEFFPKDTQIFYPEVTWPNHPTICEAARMSHHSYRYLDASGTSLDFAAMIADIRACPVASVLILHMCAHNPTGVDPRYHCSSHSFCTRLCNDYSCIHGCVSIVFVAMLNGKRFYLL